MSEIIIGNEERTEARDAVAFVKVQRLAHERLEAADSRAPNDAHPVRI